MTDDIFDPIEDSTFAHDRKAVRYASLNTKAIATYKPLLGAKKYIKVKVINISSKGACIYTRYKFSKNNKIIFNLRVMGCDDTWKIPAAVVRLCKDSEFGIIFNTSQNDLIDQIMKSEADITIV